MKLYMHPVSNTSRPIMLFAAEAKIPLENVVVDLAKGEHHGAPFVALNPNRLVPVLVDDDFVLTESSAILKYLADKFESPLYPRELRARARVNERMDWFNTNFYRDWGYNLIYPQVYPHHARPTEEHTRADIEWGKAKAKNALQLLDEWILGDRRYVCGDAMTIADMFGVQLLCAGELVRTDFSKYPSVTRWLATMKALPSWGKINEIHDGFVASLAEKAMVAP